MRRRLPDCNIRRVALFQWLSSYHHDVLRAGGTKRKHCGLGCKYTAAAWRTGFEDSSSLRAPTVSFSWELELRRRPSDSQTGSHLLFRQAEPSSKHLRTSIQVRYIASLPNQTTIHALCKYTSSHGTPSVQPTLRMNVRDV